MFAKVSTTWERKRKKGEHWIIIGSGGIPTARLSGERRLLNEPRAARWKDGGAFEEAATIKDASGNNKGGTSLLSSLWENWYWKLKNWKFKQKQMQVGIPKERHASCPQCEKIGIKRWKLKLQIKKMQAGITNGRPSLLSSQWESCYLLLPAAAAAALPKFDCFLLPFL